MESTSDVSLDDLVFVDPVPKELICPLHSGVLETACAVFSLPQCHPFRSWIHLDFLPSEIAMESVSTFRDELFLAKHEQSPVVAPCGHTFCEDCVQLPDEPVEDALPLDEPATPPMQPRGFHRSPEPPTSPTSVTTPTSPPIFSSTPLPLKSGESRLSVPPLCLGALPSTDPQESKKRKKRLVSLEKAGRSESDVRLKEAAAPLKKEKPVICCPLCNEVVSDVKVYPNLIATTLIDKLAVRCRFGKKGCPDPKEWLQEDEEGCNAVINVGQRAGHELDCEFRFLGIAFTPRSGRPRSSRAYGEVFRAQFRGTTVAVKRMVGSSWKSSFEIFSDELEFLKALRHPNIMLFLGCCTRPPNLCIVTEFLAGGDLRARLDADPDIPWKIQLQWIRDMASGLAYLHGENIVHRDVKSNNMFISESGTLKVGDFGLARMRQGDQMSQVGHWSSMAPEMLRSEKDYTEKVDVYGFGIIVWEIITQKHAEDIPRTKEFCVDMRSALKMVARGAPFGLDKLGMKSCAPEAADRPSFTDILKKLERIRAISEAKVLSDPLTRRRPRTRSGFG